MIPKSSASHRLQRAVFGALIAAAPMLPLAAQSTANFNTLIDPGNSVMYVQNCYAESGLRFTVVGDACDVMDSFATWGTADPLFYSGSPALFNNSATGTAVDITGANGEMFSLLSISLTPFLGGIGNPTTVMFEGMLSGGGMVSQTFMLPGMTNTPSMFMFNNFTAVSSVRFTVTDPTFEPYVQFDDVTASISGVAVVPEPASLLLTAAGLALVGLVARRRQRNTL